MVAVQVLVNRHTPSVVLAVDRTFGPKTHNGVVAFQKHQGVKVDGIVGPQTWDRLMHLSGHATINVVDAEDATGAAGAIATLCSAGGNPILLHGMSNEVAEALHAITQRASSSGSVVLLRFYGRGAPGDMNVSAGTGGDSEADLSGISAQNVGLLRGQLAVVGPCFAGYGSAELHGCRVSRSASSKLQLRTLADLRRVPFPSRQASGCNTTAAARATPTASMAQW